MEGRSREGEPRKSVIAVGVDPLNKWLGVYCDLSQDRGFCMDLISHLERMGMTCDRDRGLCEARAWSDEFSLGPISLLKELSEWYEGEIPIYGPAEFYSLVRGGEAEPLHVVKGGLEDEWLRDLDRAYTLAALSEDLRRFVDTLELWGLEDVAKDVDSAFRKVREKVYALAEKLGFRR